ncbi:MAG: biotin/lipoyl-containing protein [Armatimonadota bacterium]
MDKKLIKEMIDLINKNNISELEVGTDKLKISIKKMPGHGGHASSAIMLQRKPQIEEEEKPVNMLENCFTVASPLAGTFYRCPSPGAPAFVEEGDKIEPGQTLCIVEAMKLMNEISSDRSGIIRSIEASNEEAVENGRVLFYIEPV